MSVHLASLRRDRLNRGWAPCFRDSDKAEKASAHVDYPASTVRPPIPSFALPAQADSFPEPRSVFSVPVPPSYDP